MLSIVNRDFLIKQGNARVVREINVPAHRGMIVDRLGHPLALSTPVDSIWMNPQKVVMDHHQQHQLGKLAAISNQALQKKLDHKGHFVYLKRGMPPKVGEKIKALKIPGVFIHREYRRYYPEEAVAAQVVGFTNVDDRGQEGLELSLDTVLRGVVGKKLVLKDRVGHVVDELKEIRPPHEGSTVTLSVDRRIQYLAYRELKKAVEEAHAKSGSVVVLNVETGEVLGMSNWPSYNPNVPHKKADAGLRNRAVTDMFEPGSTVKPFTIVAALNSKKYLPETMVDTNPGWMNLGGYMIREHGKNYGLISVANILSKSSNIGVAKIALSLPEQLLADTFASVGFGEPTLSGFPGETEGKLPFHHFWKPIDIATLSFGYGLAVNTLQLARAYSVIASGGQKKAITFIKKDAPVPGEQVLDPTVSQTVLQLMTRVVSKHGTGFRAIIPGYQVAGKTGTAYIAGEHGYEETQKRYVASFVGIVPADRPRLVIAVVITDPQGRKHYGGQLAAPVFRRVAEGALRWLEVPPNQWLATHNEEK